MRQTCSKRLGRTR